MGFRLTIEQGTGSGQSYDFLAERVTIGRTEENDIVLYDNGCSREHARISRDGAAWVLEDLGSANGTLLNGKPVTRQALSDNDTFAIGGVVFRFADLGASADGESTRVSDLGEEELTPAPGDITNVKAAPRRPLSPVMLAVAAIVALGVAGVAFKTLRPTAPVDDGSLTCPPEITLVDVRNFVFGRGEVEVQCGDRVRFGFNHPAAHRAILAYAAFYTDKGEVEILLNGERIGEAPVVPGRRALSQTITLPKALLKEDEPNYLEFVNTRGGDEAWGIERVELDSIGLSEADLDRAQEKFELAVARYRERKVAAPNLYHAWTNFKEARRYLEGLEPKPDIYQAVLGHIRDVEKELDKVCRQKLFEAQQKATFNRYREANEVYRSILATFPGDDHPCRSRAEASMYLED